MIRQSKAPKTGNNNNNKKVILSVNEFKKTQKTTAKGAPSAKNKNKDNANNSQKSNKKTESTIETPAAKLKAALATATALSANGSGHPKRSDIKTLLDAHKKGFLNNQAFLNNLQKLVL